MLTKELATVEEAVGRPGHFSLGFGFDLYRHKEARNILVLGYESVFEAAGSYVQAAVRIEGRAHPDSIRVLLTLCSHLLLATLPLWAAMRMKSQWSPGSGVEVPDIALAEDGGWVVQGSAR